MANGNWWDKYKTVGSSAPSEEVEPEAKIAEAQETEAVATEGNWWDKYKTKPTQDVSTEVQETSALPQAEAGNWWDKYKSKGAVQPSREDEDKELILSWENASNEFNGLQSRYGQLGSRFQELNQIEGRTPEQEEEYKKTWNQIVDTGLSIQSSIKKAQKLQPQVEDYYNRQKQNRINYIESQRGSGLFGDEVADSLYDIDKRSEEEITAARQIEDGDQRKKAIADIQSKYQEEERNLLQSKIDAFKERETKINNAAEVIGNALSSGKRVDQVLLEDMAEIPEYNELRESLINQEDPEKGKLFREAALMYRLAEGSTKAAVVNGEVRISPLAVWDADAITNEINNLDVTNAQKAKAIQGIPKMQEEAAKVELPFLQKVSEFNDFVKENNLQGASPKDQIAEWKTRNTNWTEYITKAPAQVGLGLRSGSLGLLEAGQTIVGATASIMGAQDFADPFLDSASQTSEKIQELNRISQEIGGPTILNELAAVAPQILFQIGVGGAVGYGGSKLGLKPKTVSNLGFGSSIGAALGQSYGGVLSSAIQQLEKEKIDNGMDPTQARAEAVKEAQLPAALSGLSTAIVTIIGGKRGVEAPFRGGIDDIKAKLNTAAFRAELPKLAPNIFRGMRNEGYEEFFDQLAQGVIEQFSFNPDLSTSDIVNNAFKALLIGGITGGGVEGIKYGFDFMKAPKEMARRKESMASIRDSISSIEEEISMAGTSSPVGSEFQREYDITTPSEKASELGGVAINRTRMTSLQSERQQLQELLEDPAISRVARNELESKLAVADYNYYNDILLNGRANVLTEQIVDELDSRPISASSRDAITAITKIANNLGLDSLTGRERVAVGITKVGENRYLPSKENPMVATDEQGNVNITNTGKRVAEATGIVPLTRMIGLSDQMMAKREELARVAETLREEASRQEAKELAESEEAKRYGPTSAEALKNQVNSLPVSPDAEKIDERVAQLLKEEREEAARAEQIFTEEAATEERPELDGLRRVIKSEQTPEDVTALVDAGLVEIYKDQPIFTQSGIEAFPEAERPRLTTEARKIQIDTGTSDVVAEAISKNLRIGVDQVPPNVRMPEGWTLEGDIYVPPAPQQVTQAPEVTPTPEVSPEVIPETPTAEPELTTEQANKIVQSAQSARAKASQADVTVNRKYSPPPVLSLRPKDTIGKSVRDALRFASRINISSVAEKFPNEALLQDAAAILAELKIPALDNEKIVTLSSKGLRGRARRFWGGDIGLPSATKSSISTLVHEAGHTLTADQIKKYAPRKGVSGKAYLDRIRNVVSDSNTPQPISRLFSLYISTLDQLGVSEQYGGVGGIAGGSTADASRTKARRLQAKGGLRSDLDWNQLYALANIEEFVSQAFSSESFRNLLKTIKDPTNPTRSAWSAFVDAIKRILSLPDGTMAAAVIEASVDIAMEVPTPRTIKERGATPSPDQEPSILAEESQEYRDADGNIIPLEERFDITREEIDYSPEDKTVEMSLEMDKDRVFQLLGERLYTADLAKVVVKETTQNAFDAIKDAEESGEIARGSGVISYSRKNITVDGEEKVRMVFIDNGSGMTPDILQKAFFTVGGTFKRSGKGSGGFGLAKLGMFMSADNIMVETVRNGVVAKADLSRQQLSDKKFDVSVSQDPNRANGTMVALDFKAQITKSDGKVVNFENPYPRFDTMIRHNLDIITDSFGVYQEDIIKNFRGEEGSLSLEQIKNAGYTKAHTFEDFAKNLPNVKTFEKEFPVEGASKPIKVKIVASRLGMKNNNGKTKYNDIINIDGIERLIINSEYNVYSNGLFQFSEENLKLKPRDGWSSPILPYNLIIDIDAGGIDAASTVYPFNNNREGLQNGPVKEYIDGIISEIRAEENRRQFDQEFNLLTDINGGKPNKNSPTLYNNTNIVPQPTEQKFLQDLSQAVFDVADDIVVSLRKGWEDRILEDSWYLVKSQKGNAPSLGKTDEDSLDYFYGVGISKNWGGVNTSRDPVSALVNPIYEDRVDEYARTEFGRRFLARTIVKTLIHEINHHLHRNEGSDFTFFLLQNESYLGETGAIQSAVDKILPIVNQHQDAIISLKEKFRTAETKDNDNELTGEQYERSSKEADGEPRTAIVGGSRVIQQPSTEVSPRPTSEEDGEKIGAYLPSSLTARDRQDSGVGDGIPFGEVVAGQLNRGEISTTGELLSPKVDMTTDEEFVIRPEEVVPQVEGTPEFSAVKVMSKSMQLGDTQSTKLGTAEGTLPLETIVNAWLNAGLDQDALEGAVIRYTNLSDQSAANFAEAFVKQYQIQRSLSDLSSARKSEPKERAGAYSFAKRVAESGELPEEVSDKINKAYQVLRNEVSAEEAENALRNLSLDESINAVKDLTNGISFPVRSMMAQIVERRILDYRRNTKNKGKTNDYNAAVDAHVDFFNWISEYSKEMGQGIQAFAQWINLGPDGIVRKLRRDTAKIVDQNIKKRKKKLDKIKNEIEEGDQKSFNEATIRAKKSIEDLGNKAGEEEAKRVTIEDEAQKIAQRLARRVSGETTKAKTNPLSELVNSHLNKINQNFIQEAINLGISPETANKIDESAKKLDEQRRAARDQREAFRSAQEARAKISRDLARENKYIYGERPTIWEDYQNTFAERFARALLRDPKKSVPPSLMLFTNRLTQNLIGFIPETQKQVATQQSFQAFIEDALNNKDRYMEAFNAAMEEISLRVEEIEARMGGGEMLGNEAKAVIAANDFMEKLAPVIQDFPVSPKTVNRFVNQKTKALNISLAGAYNNWYRSDRRTRKNIEEALALKLLEDVNITTKDADKLSKSIVSEFKQRAEERRKKALERFKAPKKKIKSDRAARTDKLQRFFELVNMGALSDRDAYEIFAERYQLPVYDEDFVAYVEETAQRIQEMEDELARRLKTQELMSEITRNRGFDPSDIGAGFVYANILSSPDTHMVNILDTAINNFANGLADAFATGDLSRLRGIVNGYRKGIFEAAEVMKTGKRINVPGFEEKAPLILELLRFGEIDGVKLSSLEGANAIIKFLLESKPATVLNSMKYVGRLLEAQDALNFSASAEGERYAQASRLAAEEGLTGDEARKRMNQILNLSDEAYQNALRQAESEGYSGAEAKFRAMEIQDKKIPKEIKEAGFERGLRDVYRNMPVGVAGFLSDKLTNTLMSISNPLARNVSRLTVSPFIITPINLFNKWLDWSPWGYKRMFFGTGNFVNEKYYVEAFEKGSPERRAQMLKASSGILLMTVMWALVRAGVATIHGRGPSDEEERKQWLDDGNKPYSIQFGDGPLLSFAYTPWALMLSWMANVENYYKYNAKEEPDDQSALWRMAAAASFVPTIFEELPFYQGINDIIKTASAARQGDLDKAYTDFLEPKVAMLFPNFLRYVDRLFDPKVYNSDGAKALLIDQIPFVRRLGGPRLNMFGEPIGEGKKFYEQLATRFVNFPSPSRESRILAMYDAYPFIPSPKRAQALVNGEKAQMTPEQYEKYIVGVGQEFKDYILNRFDPDVEISPEEKEIGKKEISDKMEKIRAKWVRDVSTY
jgi:hypothetical protein